MKVDSYLEQVIDLTKEAGREALKYYRKEYSVEEKADDSPVTEADLASEEILIGGLKDTSPGIIAEEEGLISGESEDDYWIVDPLDGTQDFIDKTGEFSIMVGLLSQGRPVLGVVYAPATEKLWYATRGRGAYLVEDGTRTQLKVRRKESLGDYVLIASRNHFSAQDQKVSTQLGVNEIVRMGSLGIKFCSIAENRADLVYYTTDKLGIWDCCAPQVILEEAGGEALDIRGNELEYDLEKRKMARGVLGIGGGAREEVVEVLNENVKGFS